MRAGAYTQSGVHTMLGDKRPLLKPLDAMGTAGGAAEPDPKHAKDDVTKSPAERAAAAREDYSGMSRR